MNIYLYEKNNGLAEIVKTMLGEKHPLKKSLQNGAELIEELHNGKIEILIVNIKELDKNFLEPLKKANPYLIALSEGGSMADFKKALEFDIKDIVAVPIKEQELLLSIEKGVTYLIKQKNQQQKSKHLAKIVCLLSSKGGVGKSLLAANLACLLQKEHQKKVLLIDTVARYGDLDILFDVKEKKSMGFIPVEIDSYDVYWQEVEDNIITHSSGIHLLTAGEKNEEALSIAKIKTLLQAVKDKYDYIIVDTGGYLNDFNLFLLENSELALLVSTFTIPDIKNLNLALETIKGLYFSTEKIKIVINRYQNDQDLSLTDIEKFLNFKVFGLIPEDSPTVLKSINRGIPLGLNNQELPIKDALRNMTDCLLGKDCTISIPASKATGDNSSWLKAIFKQ